MIEGRITYPWVSTWDISARATGSVGGPRGAFRDITERPAMFDRFEIDRLCCDVDCNRDIKVLYKLGGKGEKYLQGKLSNKC